MDIYNDPVMRFIYNHKESIGLNYFPFYEDHDGTLVFTEREAPFPMNLTEMYLLPQDCEIRNLMKCINYINEHADNYVKDSLENEIREMSSFKILSVLFQIASDYEEFPFSLAYELCRILEKNNFDVNQILFVATGIDGIPELE